MHMLTVFVVVILFFKEGAIHNKFKIILLCIVSTNTVVHVLFLGTSGAFSRTFWGCVLLP